ncbi:hypothetical protein GCM10009851_04960 [Herbiconiux moechotypicola]|uniref:Integral membrane protein n=1 Tax=Herbiconiux moechotypicola TaxID=637393 RepID=A0ABN3D9F1_9MICO
MLRALARLLPSGARGRYLEEWRADAAGAAELGLRRRDVVLGAAVVTLTLDRDVPDYTGEPRGSRPRRLARRGIALTGASGVVLLGLLLTGGGIVPEGPGATPAVLAALESAGWLVLRLAIALALVGAVMTAIAAFTARTALARAALFATLLAPVFLVMPLAHPLFSDGLAPLVLAAVSLLVGIFGLAAGLAVVVGSPPLALQPRRATRRQRLPVAVGGAVAMLAIVVVGGLDTLVWNPLAKAPGLGLGEVYRRMASDDGFFLGTAVVAVTVWAVFWLVPALVLVVIAARRGSTGLTPRRIVVIVLALVGGAVFFRFFAGFSIGMSIADTFMTSGGDSSVISAVLPIVGQLALAGALVALGWAPRVSREADVTGRRPRGALAA